MSDTPEAQEVIEGSGGAKKRQRREQKYRKAWEKQFPWVKPSMDPHRAMCCSCNVEISAQITPLKLHENSAKHKKRSLLSATEVSAKTTEEIHAAFNRANLDNDPLSVMQVKNSCRNSVDEQHSEYEEKLRMSRGSLAPPPSELPGILSIAPTVMGKDSAVGDQPYNSIGLLPGDEERNKIQDTTIGKASKTRWFSQTGQCQHPLENKQLVSGQAAGKRRYEEEMSIIKPSIQKQETVSSLDIPDYPEAVDKIDFLDEKDSVITFGIQRSLYSENTLAGEERRNTEGNIAPKISWLKQETAASTQDNTCTCITRSSTPNRKTTQGSIIETEASFLLKYILDQKKDAPRSTNHIDAFLFGIAETVKLFPPIYQHMVKSKISKVVSDIELELLLKTQASSDFKVSEGSQLLHSTVSTPSPSQGMQNLQPSYSYQEEAGSPETSGQM